MASNSSSCSTPGSGHLNTYPVPHYAFFFPHMIGGLSPPGALPGMQHQLPVSGYSTPSPASEYPIFKNRGWVVLFVFVALIGELHLGRTQVQEIWSGGTHFENGLLALDTNTAFSVLGGIWKIIWGARSLSKVANGLRQCITKHTFVVLCVWREGG